ncbi:ATP synthase gamma chain [Nymphaea thermarum]|nr:ATP synthase gamma chain [Nymphaea thermarum]
MEKPKLLGGGLGSARPGARAREWVGLLQWYQSSFNTRTWCPTRADACALRGWIVTPHKFSPVLKIVRNLQGFIKGVIDEKIVLVPNLFRVETETARRRVGIRHTRGPSPKVGRIVTQQGVNRRAERPKSINGGKKNKIFGQSDPSLISRGQNPIRLPKFSPLISPSSSLPSFIIIIVAHSLHAFPNSTTIATLLHNLHLSTEGGRTQEKRKPTNATTMACSNLPVWLSKSNSQNPLSPSSSSSASPFSHHHHPNRRRSTIVCGLRELRGRIESVKNTQKITEAMKLVAAAKVRRAQEAVVNGRPFSETLVEVLYNINQQLQTDDVDVPLTTIRPVRKIALVVITGDRGLCGGFNNNIIKKAEARIAELRSLGLDFTVVSVGKKGNSYFNRRPYIPVDRFLEVGTLPTAKEAQAIADDVFSLFVSEDVDKVELLYTKFVSLVKSEPVIHTLLPLSPKGEVCDINGNCVDAAEDELFRLTTKEGKLRVERDVVRLPTAEFSPILQFEQDPVQILDALLPLYLNSQILRALQESLASELAARMAAMSNATDNAVELKRSLSIAYNRERQAKITGEILEIVAGAEALT